MTENYPPYPTRLVPTTGGQPPQAPPGSEPYYPPTPGRGGAGRGGGGAAGPGDQPTGTPVFNRQNFIKTYANMVARTWTDDSYLQLILSDPVKALASAGIPTPQGAVIRVVQCKISRMGSMDDQVNDWVEGYRTGRFDLYLAIKPDDIDVPPGGGEPGVGGGDVSSCCCTPCCCCT